MTANERFAGAVDTYTIEALMQDGKALQAGTSHYLGQNFAKAFEVTFLNESNQQEFVYATSWGVSTRLIGGLIMTHSDDDGLMFPPKLAPVQVVFVPIPKPTEEIDRAIGEMSQRLKALGVRIQYDSDTQTRPGFKFAEHELRGVPIRIAVGPRDLEQNQVEVARRDTREKRFVKIEDLSVEIPKLLADIQSNMFNKAKQYRDEHITPVDTMDEFVKVLDEKGGFVLAHWDGTVETEEKIKELTKATARCIPLDGEKEPGLCVLTGNPSAQRILFARSY